MPAYLVDLTSLAPSDRVKACERIATAAWEVFEQYVSHELVAAKVMWDRAEDFATSSVFPAGCKCTKISD